MSPKALQGERLATASRFPHRRAKLVLDLHIAKVRMLGKSDGGSAFEKF